MTRNPKNPRRKPQVNFCDCMDHAWTVLTKGFVALVSPEDSDLLAAHLWSAQVCSRSSKNTVYAARSVNGKKPKRILLHREIVGAVGTVQIDHRTHNGLDNRRGNLRPGTRSQNLANRRLNKNSTTGFKGVYVDKGLYRADLRCDGERFCLGRYGTPEEAARAYDAKAREMWGEFALTNFAEAAE